MGIIKSFDIRRLTPFRKRDEGMPESAATGENLADLDPNLRADEESYVRHYLNYADRLLSSESAKDSKKEERPSERPNVVQIPLFEDGSDKAA